MRTTEQRIAVLHQRAGQLRRRQEMTVLSGLASLSLVLIVLLVQLAAVSYGHIGRIAGDAYTAASLLDENVGGYVLAAVLAFMAGVCVTVVIIRYRDRNDKNRCPEKPDGDRENDKTGSDPG